MKNNSKEEMHPIKFYPPKEMLEAKIISEKYNATSVSQPKKRDELLKELINVNGENVVVLSPFLCDYGSNITVGDNTFINYNCVILDEGKVNIGKFVRIAPNVSIYTVGHHEDPEKRKLGVDYFYDINIEDNVWIGGNSVILPGVTIGQNSIIGAGSVVRHDIPKNSVACGNPCKVIRKIREDK